MRVSWRGPTGTRTLASCACGVRCVLCRRSSSRPLRRLDQRKDHLGVVAKWRIPQDSQSKWETWASLDFEASPYMHALIRAHSTRLQVKSSLVFGSICSMDTWKVPAPWSPWPWIPWRQIRTDECAYGIIGRGIWYFVHHTPIHLWGGGPRWGYWAGPDSWWDGTERRLSVAAGAATSISKEMVADILGLLKDQTEIVQTCVTSSWNMLEF